VTDAWHARRHAPDGVSARCTIRLHGRSFAQSRTRTATPGAHVGKPGETTTVMISGTTTVIAHLGYPTAAFKAPLIYNPYFERAGIDAVVVPMGVRAEDYEPLLRPLFAMTNLRGALVTMPHKVTTAALLDDVTPAVKVSGACNAILKRPDGSLLGDMFDGEGFVRGAARKGMALRGAAIRCRSMSGALRRERSSAKW